MTHPDQSPEAKKARAKASQERYLTSDKGKAYLANVKLTVAAYKKTASGKAALLRAYTKHKDTDKGKATIARAHSKPAYIAYMKAYSIANKEAVKEKNLAASDEQKARKNAVRRLWASNNKDKVAAIVLAYRLRHGIVSNSIPKLDQSPEAKKARAQADCVKTSAAKEAAKMRRNGASEEAKERYTNMKRLWRANNKDKVAASNLAFRIRNGFIPSCTIPFDQSPEAKKARAAAYLAKYRLTDKYKATRAAYALKRATPSLHLHPVDQSPEANKARKIASRKNYKTSPEGIASAAKYSEGQKLPEARVKINARVALYRKTDAGKETTSKSSRNYRNKKAQAEGPLHV